MVEGPLDLVSSTTKKENEPTTAQGDKGYRESREKCNDRTNDRAIPRDGVRKKKFRSFFLLPTTNV